LKVHGKLSGLKSKEKKSYDFLENLKNKKLESNSFFLTRKMAQLEFNNSSSNINNNNYTQRQKHKNSFDSVYVEKLPNPQNAKSIKKKELIKMSPNKIVKNCLVMNSEDTRKIFVRINNSTGDLHINSKYLKKPEDIKIQNSNKMDFLMMHNKSKSFEEEFKNTFNSMKNDKEILDIIENSDSSSNSVSDLNNHMFLPSNESNLKFSNFQLNKNVPARNLVNQYYLTLQNSSKIPDNLSEIEEEPSNL